LIYTPVDNPKVSIRPLISRKDAEDLIAQIPSIHAETCRAPTLQALALQYQEALHSGSCLTLLRMVMSIYAKKQQAEAQKRRLGMVDERYMKQGERLLHSELAAVLDIPFDEVSSYIAKQLNLDSEH
jgi:CarD family transcriptional regulator